jgi:hypothetical protein
MPTEKDPQETKPERPPNTFEAEQDFKDRLKILGDLADATEEEFRKGQAELNREGKGDWKNDSPPEPIRGLFILMVLLAFVMILAVAAFYFTTGSDLLTGLREDPPAADSNISADPIPAEAPSHEELQAQEPIPITDGPWRFFADASEESALYDIKFEEDGSCYVPGDQIVYGGSYTVSGNQIEIELYRRYMAESKNSEGDIRTQEVEWTEWFHMTRAGNTMTGYWEVEGWRFSYDDGLKWTGVSTNGPDIFSRPERPEDPG